MSVGVRRPMTLVAGVGMFVVVLWCSLCSLTYAQQIPGDDRIRDPRFYNKDYFAANHDSDTKHLLYLVEKFHLDNKVWKAFKASKFQIVLNNVQYTLRRFPNHPKALQLMGATARLSKNFALAVPYYEKALSLYPQYAITHAQYGAYLSQIGQIQKGITKLKQAIAIDSDLAPAHAWLAQAYAKSGNLNRARQAAEQARRLGYKGKIMAGR